MPSQRLTIRAADLTFDFTGFLRWNFSGSAAQALDAGFGTPARYLRELFFVGVGSSQLQIIFDFSESQSTSGRADLVEEWEGAETAVRFEQGSRSVEVSGPAWTDGGVRDSADDYRWRPNAAQTTAVNGFFACVRYVGGLDPHVVVPGPGCGVPVDGGGFLALSPSRILVLNGDGSRDPTLALRYWGVGGRWG